MRITELSVKNFRNHINKTLHFDENTTLISGKNGAGKTSILEAITILSTTKSFKTHKEIEVITEGKTNAYVKGYIKDRGQEELGVSFEKMHIGRIKKLYFLDQASKRPSVLVGKLYTVLFTTDLINSFAERPIARRKFFNQFLCQLDKEYLIALSHYEKVVKNKNKLLKMIQSGSSHSQLMFWNEQLILSATQLTKKRIEFISNISAFLSKFSTNESFSQRDINISYLSKYVEKYEEGFLIEELIRGDILQHEKVEIDSGRCLVGPHKDDYDVFFNNKNIKQFASRGEQKFSIAFLLYAIAMYIFSIKESSPIILLDDLSAEMDEFNLHKILDLFLETNFQIILTAIEKKQYLSKVNKVIEI